MRPSSPRILPVCFAAFAFANICVITYQKKKKKKNLSYYIAYELSFYKLLTLFASSFVNFLFCIKFLCVLIEGLFMS